LKDWWNALLRARDAAIGFSTRTGQSTLAPSLNTERSDWQSILKCLSNCTIQQNPHSLALTQESASHVARIRSQCAEHHSRAMKQDWRGAFSGWLDARDFLEFFSTVTILSNVEEYASLCTKHIARTLASFKEQVSRFPSNHVRVAGQPTFRIALYGDSGAGKTHMLSLLRNEAVMHGARCEVDEGTKMYFDCSNPRFTYPVRFLMKKPLVDYPCWVEVLDYPHEVLVPGSVADEWIKYVHRHSHASICIADLATLGKTMKRLQADRAGARDKNFSIPHPTLVLIPPQDFATWQQQDDIRAAFGHFQQVSCINSVQPFKDSIILDLVVDLVRDARTRTSIAIIERLTPVVSLLEDGKSDIATREYRKALKSFPIDHVQVLDDIHSAIKSLRDLLQPQPTGITRDDVTVDTAMALKSARDASNQGATEPRVSSKSIARMAVIATLVAIALALCLSLIFVTIR